MRFLSAFALLFAACSLIADHSAVQCRTDADCAHFGGHPYCQDNVCVASGLGPENCVVGAPQSQTDYLNACTTAQNLAFDNCERLGLCDTGFTLPQTVAPTNPTIPPIVNPVAAPTALCTDGATNVIYMYGTSDFAPMLAAVQPMLYANTPSYRTVYQNASSCAGVASVFDSAKRLMKNPASGPSANYAFYFDASGQRVNCLVDTNGNTIDIGVSNLYATTCSNSTATYVPGTAVADYTGPVVPFVLSTPEASTQRTISAEALYMVFGLGGGDAAPWTAPTYYFIRNGSAGSTVLTARLIGVPETKFWGIDRLSTDNLRDSLLASAAADSSIGILSIDYADKNRGNLRSLYLQAKGQSSGYLPDSNENSFDKMNVRDGHYPLWGYQHFFTPIGPGGVPSDAAKAFVTRFSVSRLDQGLLDNIIAASLVPRCAMKVSRKDEVADYSSHDGLQCGCYFDHKTTGDTKPGCTPCSSTSDCPTERSACNYGFCETN